MLAARIMLLVTLAVLGFTAGQHSGVERNGSSPVVPVIGDTGARNPWHVPRSTVTLLDTLQWREKLSEHAFNMKLGEALETMPIHNLRELARTHRETAYSWDTQIGYYDVHAAFIRRAPWIAVQDLLENAEWEREIMEDSDGDLDLEDMISRALAQLYETEPDRVLAVLRSLKSPWLIQNGILRSFEGEQLLAVVEATEQSDAGKTDQGRLIGLKIEAIEKAYTSIAKSDPGSALDTAEEIGDPKLRMAALLAVLRVIDDPVPLARRLFAAGTLGARSVARWLPDETFDWARNHAVTDPEAQSILASKIQDSLKSGDDASARILADEFFTPKEAAKIWREHEDSAPKDAAWLQGKRKISRNDVLQWARDNPATEDFHEASRAFDDLTPTRDAWEATAAFAGEWAGRPDQGEAAANWAETVNHPGTRRRALVWAVGSWARSDPVTATAWALHLEPEEVRNSAIAASMNKAIDKDPVAARSILQRARLPERYGKAFEERLMKVTDR